MIQFFNNEDTVGSASIYEAHITFNKSMLKYFEFAYRVQIGIDKEESKVYIFMINKDYALSGEIPQSSLLPVSTSKTYARVCSRAMVEYICSCFNLSIDKKSFLKFDAIYDEKLKAIVLNMKGEKK